MRVVQPIPWLLCRRGARRVSHNIPCAIELPKVHPHNMDENKIWTVGSNIQFKHTTKPLAWTDTLLESTRRKEELFEWSFYKSNPGRKIQCRYWREWTPAEPWEPQAHPVTGTTMSSQASFSKSFQPICPTLQSATYFHYTLNVYVYGETNSGTGIHSADCFQYRKCYYPGFSKRK